MTWLNCGTENSQYDTRTLVVSGVHISKFHAHLLSADSYYKVPDFEDVLYLKCKTSYRLPILDENKCSMEASNISDGDRVMCTFTVSHWLLKSKEEGFKMNLLAIRHLPCEDGDEDNFNPEIYTGPDF